MNRLRSKSHLVVGAALGLPSACSTYASIGRDGLRDLLTPIVKKQTAFDLQCTEDQVQVVQLAPRPAQRGKG